LSTSIICLLRKVPMAISLGHSSLCPYAWIHVL
jgi:hypothetical protein